MFLQRFLALVTRYDRWLLWVGIPLLSIVLHGRVWNLELTGPHVWRQTQTQQAIDSFVEEDFCILNPRKLERGDGDGIFRMEFPLFQWLIAACGKVLGPTVLLTRCLTFLIACGGIWAAYFLLLALRQDRLTALLASYLFALSPVVHYYAVSPLPDVMAMTCALWGSVFALRMAVHYRRREVVGAAIFLGLAALVKLPYLMFYALPGVWMLQQLWVERAWRRVGFTTVVMGLAALPMAIWYAWVIPQWSEVGAVTGLFTAGVDMGEIVDILVDHLTQMVPRTLMSIVAVPLFVLGVIVLGMRKQRFVGGAVQGWMLLGFALAFGFYYAYEVVMISYYHDYYMLPLLLLLIVPQAIGAATLLQNPTAWRFGIVVGLLALMPYMTYRRIHSRWQPAQAEFNRDLVIHQAALRAAVPDDALVVAGPDVSHNIFLYYIHKKGWVWDENQAFDGDRLRMWRDQGAAYLYCDDRAYDTIPSVRAVLGPEIARFGDVRVYGLR